MPSLLHIGSRAVGRGHPCYMVAEVAQAHDGSLGAAHAHIDAAARAGVDAVKFQTHIASAESTPAEPWRVRFSQQDASRYDYWRRMGFTEEQWHGLATHAAEKKLEFLSTPFSFEAVELLERVGVRAWKVASGEVGNTPLLKRLASTGKPVILSSGMSSWSELDRAVEIVRAKGAALGVLQCTTAYPTPASQVGLDAMLKMGSRYDVPYGLSDHSATIFAGLAAVTLGASLVEVHLALSRECFGPDTSSSLTPAELTELVRGVRFVEQALAAHVDKDAVASELAPLRRTFGKSVVAARDLDAGVRLAASDLALKKPGAGLPPDRFDDVVGRTLRRPVRLDEALAEDDLV